MARCKSVSVRSFDLPSRIETFSVSVVTRRFPAIIAIKPPGCLDRPVPSTLGLPSPICRAADDYGNNTFASIATRNNDTDTAARLLRRCPMESTAVVLSSKRPWIASFATFSSIKTFLYGIDSRDRIISVKLEDVLRKWYS